jgi:hypothetical protein
LARVFSCFRFSEDNWHFAPEHLRLDVSTIARADLDLWNVLINEAMRAIETVLVPCMLTSRVILYSSCTVDVAVLWQ